MKFARSITSRCGMQSCETHRQFLGNCFSIILLEHSLAEEQCLRLERNQRDLKPTQSEQTKHVSKDA